VHHVFDQGNQTGDIFRRVDYRDDDRLVVSHKVRSVKLSRFSVTLQSAKNCGSGDLHLSALRHDRLI
jgi:hypothetical protein